jgi:hypothetical protein
MNLDIRIPTGLLFSIIGVILVIYGAVTHFTDPTMYEKSLNINVNLWWGLALVAFGMVMLALAWRASHAEKKP